MFCIKEFITQHIFWVSLRVESNKTLQSQNADDSFTLISFLSLPAESFHPREKEEESGQTHTHAHTRSFPVREIKGAKYIATGAEKERRRHP